MPDATLSSSAGDWETKTHVWADSVDEHHLHDARARFGATGPEHMVLEVLAYADEEAASRGVVGRTIVQVRDHEVSIDDDGRGTETRRDAAGRYIRKPVMSSRDVRFYGVPSAPLLPDGIARRGMSTVAAVSAHLTHENHRSHSAWRQDYEYGVPREQLAEVPFRGRTGTVVSFSVDDACALDLARIQALASHFGNLVVDVRDLRTRCGAAPVRTG